MAIQEYLSENKHRRYPFTEDSSLRDMPDWLLLDIRLVDAAFDGDTALLKCTRYVHGDNVHTMVFKYSTTSDSIDFTITVEQGSDITVGTITLGDACVVKYAVCGGGFEHSQDTDLVDIELDAEVLRTRLVTIDKRMYVTSLGGCKGLVHIVDGHNTEARTVDGVTTITVGNGAGLGADCEQPDDAFDCTKALLFMNGQHADTQGNININGGPGVTVQTGRTAMVNGVIVPAITIRADPQIKEIY